MSSLEGRSTPSDRPWSTMVPWSVPERNKCPKFTSKRRTDLKICVPEAKFVKESDFDFKTRLTPTKSTENDEKRFSDTEKCRRNKKQKSRRKHFLGVDKSKVANRLKRVLTKFDANRSHVRGVNGRSKFDDRTVAKEKYCDAPLGTNVVVTSVIVIVIY